MAPDEAPVAEPTAGTSKPLYRVSYVDTVVRETFVNARNENEAQDIVEEEIANGDHHHMIDAYREDMQAEPVNDIGRRTMCYECGSTGE